MKEPLLMLSTNITNAPARRFTTDRNGGHSLLGVRGKYPGMDKTVQNISQIIKQYRGDERIRDAALQISSSVRPDARTGMADMRNFDAIADAVYNWIVQRIHYVRDPNGIERLQTPDATLKLRTGDCDDMVILGASLLESVGIPTRIKLIGEKRGQYTHIYMEYLAKGEWVPFDPTLALYLDYQLPEKLFKANKTVAIERPDNNSVPPKAISGRTSSSTSRFLYT